MLAGVAGATLAPTHDDWVRQAVALTLDADRRSTMRRAARQTALDRSWSGVFDTVYQAYATAITLSQDGACPSGAPALPAAATEERAAS